jgi:hypothetical protein
MVIAEKIREAPRVNVIIALMAVVIVLAVGYAIASSRASSPYGTVEAEGGTVSGNGPVTTGSDVSASGGQYIQFAPKQ